MLATSSAYSSKPGVKLEFLRFRNANYIQENSGTHNAATSHSVYGYIRVFPLPCSVQPRLDHGVNNGSRMTMVLTV